MRTLAKVSVVLDDYIEEYGLDCLTLRCWEEMQQPKLIKLGQSGFRHHTAIGVGHMGKVLREAFPYYLGYEIMEL